MLTRNPRRQGCFFLSSLLLSSLEVIDATIYEQGGTKQLAVRQVELDEVRGAAVKLQRALEEQVRLPGTGNSNARPVHQIITMIKWIRTSKLSLSMSRAARATRRRSRPRARPSAPRWIEPEIAQYPKSTSMIYVLARGGPVPIRSSQPQALRVGSNRLFQVLDLFWRSATCGKNEGD